MTAMRTMMAATLGALALAALSGCGGPPLEPVAQEFCRAYEQGDWNAMLDMMPGELAAYYRGHETDMEEMARSARENKPDACRPFNVRGRLCRDLYFITKRDSLKSELGFDIGTVNKCASFEYELVYGADSQTLESELYLVGGEWRVIPSMTRMEFEEEPAE